MEKNVRGGDITPATSTSQEEEVPLQENFIDENLDTNMEELNETMEIIHEPKLYLDTTHTACQIILLLVILTKTNLTQ